MLLRDEIYTELKRRILHGEFSPGIRISYAEIATEMAASRTPVREALRRLEDEGYVETFASRWTEVKRIDPGQAARMYPIVGALESVALRFAEPITDAELAELRAANSAVRESLGTGDWITIHATDQEFHRVLVARCENPELHDIYTNVRERLLRFTHLYWDTTPVVRESADEHEAVIELLASRENEAAAAAINGHWENSMRRTFTARPEATSAGAAVIGAAAPH